MDIHDAKFGHFKTTPVWQVLSIPIFPAISPDCNIHFVRIVP